MSGGGGSSKKLILVVDDDPDIRSIVARALTPTYVIREAADGREAALALAARPFPDLVILDVTMPHTDGLALAAQIKADPQHRGLPIIFLTARTAPADVIRGIQAGARSYMTKPFKIEELRQKVGKVLG